MMKYRIHTFTMPCPMCDAVDTHISQVLVTSESADIYPAQCDQCGHSWAVYSERIDNAPQSTEKSQATKD